MKRDTGPRHVEPRPVTTARSAYGSSSSPSSDVRRASPSSAPVRTSSATVDSHSPSRGTSARPPALSASNARRACVGAPDDRHRERRRRPPHRRRRVAPRELLERLLDLAQAPLHHPQREELHGVELRGVLRLRAAAGRERLAREPLGVAPSALRASRGWPDTAARTRGAAGRAARRPGARGSPARCPRRPSRRAP